MTSFLPEHKSAPFSMVFVGISPKLVAWAKLDDLSKSTDPQVIPVLRQLEHPCSDDELLKANPGVRSELKRDGYCLMDND